MTARWNTATALCFAPEHDAEVQLPDVICFSHLRWNFVFQRPQHLLSRIAKDSRVFLIEEPVFTDDGTSELKSHDDNNVTVITPTFRTGTDQALVIQFLRE